MLAILAATAACLAASQLVLLDANWNRSSCMNHPPQPWSGSSALRLHQACRWRLVRGLLSCRGIERDAVAAEPFRIVEFCVGTLDQGRGVVSIIKLCDTE